MNCRQVCNLIPDYMGHKLSAQELEPFLEHMNSCKDCQEELEFYYILQTGLKEDTDDISEYNIKKTEARDYRLALSKVKQRRAFLVVKYAVSTVAFWSVVLSMVMQAVKIFWR